MTQILRLVAWSIDPETGALSIVDFYETQLVHPDTGGQKLAEQVFIGNNQQYLVRRDFLDENREPSNPKTIHNPYDHDPFDVTDEPFVDGFQVNAKSELIAIEIVQKLIQHGLKTPEIFNVLCLGLAYATAKMPEKLQSGIIENCRMDIEQWVPEIRQKIKEKEAELEKENAV